MSVALTTGSRRTSSPSGRARAATERSWRGATVVISVVVHAMAGVAAVAYSFWHIEEVTPARVTVTFVSAAALPAPPRPPPPLASGAAAPAAAPKHRPATRLKTDPTPIPVPDKPTPVVETSAKVPVVETPHEGPAGDPHVQAGNGEGRGTGEGAGKGPKGPGTTPCNGPNCVASGTPGAPAGAPKFLPPQMGAQLKISGAEPDFPAFLRRPGANYLVLAKICVGVSGAVDAVTLQKRAEPTLDNNVGAAVKAWRFRPMTANGMPVPFCYFGRFEFKSD
jgi:outer membrane biosynthesis protein TonB